MKIWVDMSAPAHVLVLRPIIERLRAQGHEVDVTSRDYAQTQQLLDLHGIAHTPIGRHGGASRLRKGYRLVARTLAMRRFGSRRQFDLALAHGSNDLALAARSLGIPEANMHDYEYAVTQHRIGCRLARRVLFPDSVPPARLRRFGVTPEKLFSYPGIKEEYYLFDFEPDPQALARLGVDPERITVIVRPPPEVSLYHRKSNPLFPRVLSRIGSDPEIHAVVLPRTTAQRQFLEHLALPSLIIPPAAVEAQSLIALADLVVSAGGTMNREAVALGTPVYTTYGGRLGGVDEALIRSGLLRPLTDPRAMELRKRTGSENRTRRDPALLVETILGTVGEPRSTPAPVS
jgi:predicted glycosyltransferase